MVLAIFSLLAILLSHDMTQSLACTVIESGSNERRACQFPFTINGQTYDNCTRQHDPDRKPWCSTKVMNGYHVSGGDHWGYCTERVCFVSSRNVTNQNPVGPRFGPSLPTVPEVTGNIDDICGRIPKSSRFIQSPDHDRDFPQGHWPYVVSIGYFKTNGLWVHQCGGTIISRDHVLTAAHCLLQPNKLIKFGETDLGTDRDDVAVEERKITRVHTHPSFNSNSEAAYNDVAVAEFDGGPLRFNPNVLPICLPNSPKDTIDYRARESATVVGFGQQERGEKSNITSIKRAPLKIFSQLHCNLTHDAQEVEVNVRKAIPSMFTNGLFCAGSELGGLGPCKGDSGGPLLQYSGLPEKKYTQLGIVYGAVSECGHQVYPGIFVNLEDPDIYWFVMETIGRGKRPRIPVETTTSRPRFPEPTTKRTTSWTWRPTRPRPPTTPWTWRPTRPTPPTIESRTTGRPLLNNRQREVFSWALSGSDIIEDDDYSDNRCRTDEFWCPYERGNCIKKDWVCDGDKDCTDGSDEKNCPRMTKTTCPVGEYKCPTSPQICIPMAFLCDGFKHCLDGSDEVDCNNKRVPPLEDDLDPFSGIFN